MSIVDKAGKVPISKSNVETHLPQSSSKECYWSHLSESVRGQKIAPWGIVQNERPNLFIEFHGNY